MNGIKAKVKFKGDENPTTFFAPIYDDDADKREDIEDLVNQLKDIVKAHYTNNRESKYGMINIDGNIIDLSETQYVNIQIVE